MPFKKGQSGNPKGAPKRQDSLRSWLIRAGRKKNEDGVTWDEALIETLFATALGGSVAAMRLILESRLGKPAVMEVGDLGAASASVKMYVSVSPDEWPSE